jgi:hypothetical protein
MNKVFLATIEKKLVLRFVYEGKERVVEPQTYGISRTGKGVLRARQIGGGSRSGQPRIAKLFDIEKISGLRITGEHFGEALPEHNPNDSAIESIRQSSTAQRKVNVGMGCPSMH